MSAGSLAMMMEAAAHGSSSPSPPSAAIPLRSSVDDRYLLHLLDIYNIFIVIIIFDWVTATRSRPRRGTASTQQTNIQSPYLLNNSIFHFTVLNTLIFYDFQQILFPNPGKVLPRR